MNRIRPLVALTAFATAVAASALVVSAPAQADDPPPPPPVQAEDAPPPPAAPAAGIPSLTPEQQCAWIAYRLWMPCNWVMNQPPPPGTPGTLYGQTQP
jgi:hypothetical protein